MFIAALEYRKYVQKPRTAIEKNKKLTDLAIKEKAVSKSALSCEELIDIILNDYRNGVDILDPDVFPKEDIESFAVENKIDRDPLVIKFIESAKPEIEWI